MSNYAHELSVAINLARQSGDIQQKARHETVSIKKKSDTSPVSEIDTACETLIRAGVLASFPDDGFLGEESGGLDGTSGRRWIVDPLDGTRPFIRRIPTYSTLIALEENHLPVLGVIHLPAMNITCWASSGNGAFLNGQPIRVAPTAHLGDAMGSALGFVEHQDSALRDKLLSVMRSWDYTYGFMDAYSYVCVASGRLDCCVNLLDKPWDCAAAACIVTEAGGTYSDIKGVQSVHNGSFVVSNGLLHQGILDFFAG